MFDLDLLLEGNAALLELAENNKRIGFSEACGRIIREIVLSFQERIAELDPESALRLRIEPTYADRLNRFAPIPLPTRLILVSGDLRWGIPIRCGETVSFIGETLVTTHRDNATMRLAEAIVDAIRRALGNGSLEPEPDSELEPPAASRSEALARLRTAKLFDSM